MAEAKAAGPVQVTGSTVEELKRSVQFWLQYLVDQLNALKASQGSK